MVIYKNDVRVSYSTDMRNKPKGGNKKMIRELTRESLANMVFTAHNTDVEFKGMITLTYPDNFPKDGKESKSHLNRFLTSIRRVTDIEYLWFMEFQKRGAPHYHILTSVDPTGIMDEVAIRWYRAAGSRGIKHLMAGTRCERLRRVDGAARYAAKYAAKVEQKIVPENYQNCGRFWGNSKGVPPNAKGHINFRGGTGEDLQAMMRELGWEYHESLTKPLKTLYNAGKLIKT